MPRTDPPIGQNASAQKMPLLQSRVPPSAWLLPLLLFLFLQEPASNHSVLFGPDISILFVDRSSHPPVPGQPSDEVAVVLLVSSLFQTALMSAA